MYLTGRDYRMMRERSLAKNTAMLMIGKICTQAVSYFLLPLYTSVLATEEYGIADLIVTYVSLLYPVVGMQFEQGLFRMVLDYRDDREDNRTLFSTVMICNLFQIIAFILLFVPIKTLINSKYAIFLLPLVIIQILQGTFLQFARGIDRTDIYTIGSFIFAVLHVGVNAILVGIIRVGLTGMFYSMIIAGIGSSLYVFIRLKIWIYFDIRLFNKHYFCEVAKYSIPLIPNQLAWWVINVSDRTIIVYYLGVGANGIYSLANKFSSVYIIFYNYFNMSWTESVSLAINDADKNEYISRMINIFFNLIAALCIGIIACMPFVFPILVNQAYKASYYQIPILMIAVFFQALQGLYSAIYVALKKTKEIAKTSIISAFINLFVNLMLIRRFGLFAASASTLVAFFLMALYRYFDVKKYVPIKIDIKNILFGMVTCCIVCIAYYNENLIICAGVFLIACAYSVLINKGLLSKSIEIIKQKTRKIGR